METPNVIDLTPLMTWRGKVDSPDYDRCILCQKAIKDPRKAGTVHMVDGGFSVIPVAQPYDNEAAEMGWWNIGPECARKLPTEYIQKGA